MALARVLILHPALAPYRVDTFNALAERCTLRLVFLAANVANQPFDQDRLRRLLKVEPHYLLKGFSLAGRTVRFGIGDELRRFRPDVVVTTEFGQATLSVAASRRRGAGTFAHVVSTEDNPCSVEDESWLHGVGRRFLLPDVDGVLTYSEEARAIYLERFGATQPVVASPLVQEERVIRGRFEEAGPAARAEAVARGLLGKRVLLCVGRLAPEKRVDRLIDAVGRLQGAWPDLVLALVGDGPERERLEQRAASAAPGRVLFAGRLEGERLAAWYRLGSVFALASAYEPFGAVVNEALLAGMPVICSHRAGARALVVEGRNGAVVDAGRPETLDEELAAWLRRQSPVSEAQLEAQRASLMQTTFGDAVDAYLAALEKARDHRRTSSRAAASDGLDVAAEGAPGASTPDQAAPAGRPRARPEGTGALKQAPIAIFAYRRPELTARLLRSLLSNPEAQSSRVYAFCDGPRSEEDVPLVARTRQAVADAGLRHLELVERPRNMGLAANVIDGVTRLCQAHGRVIVLEDDLILSRTFLRYMNDALDRYEGDPRVLHVSGFMYPLAGETAHDALFLPFISSWGWGTWARAWQAFEPAPSRPPAVLADPGLRRRFDLDGSYGFSRMLGRQLAGRSDSWAIRWYLSVFTQGGLSLFPRRSLVENDGFDLDSTHCTGPRPRHASSQADDFEVRSFPPVAVDEEAFARVKAVLAADSTLLARGLRRLRHHGAHAARWGQRLALGSGNNP